MDSLYLFLRKTTKLAAVMNAKRKKIEKKLVSGKRNFGKITPTNLNKNNKESPVPLGYQGVLGFSLLNPFLLIWYLT